MNIMSREEREAIAQRIRPAREALRLTQLDVAEAAGVSVGTVQNIESGRAVPQEGRLVRIMSVLGIEREASERNSQAYPESIEAVRDAVGMWLLKMDGEERFVAMGRLMRVLADLDNNS